MTGYRNLLELSSLGYTEGFYYKPRIDDELLERHHEGVIALSACLAGDIPAAIMDGQPGEARKRALYYRELFGPDGFYLEMQDHGIPEQGVVNKELVRISRETGHPPGGNERHPLHGARGRARAGRSHLHRHREEGVRGQADEVRAPRVLLQVG